MIAWLVYAALLALDVAVESTVAAALSPSGRRRDRARLAAAATLLTHGLGTLARVHGALDIVTCEALGAAVDFVLWRTLGGAGVREALRLTWWTNFAAIVAPFGLWALGTLG